MEHQTRHEFYPRGKFQKAPWNVRQAAVGFATSKKPFEELNREQQLFFTNPEEFPDIPPQESNDWIPSFKEPPQSYQDWKKGSVSVFASCGRGGLFIWLILPFRDKDSQAIYLLPIGQFTPNESPNLTHLAEFTQAYFGGMKVIVMPASECIQKKRHLQVLVNSHTFELTSRINPETKLLQLRTSDIEDMLFSINRLNEHGTRVGFS